MGIKKFRSVPLGQPPSNQEELNPGRYMFASYSSTEYHSGSITQIADPYSFVWVDQLLKVTADGSNETEPFFINRKVNWRSGPSVNQTVADNSVPGAGYWTDSGGPHAYDGKTKRPGFQMETSSDRPIMLYNMGHENIASKGGSAETSVIGWDGYLYADKQTQVFGKPNTLLGACHAYAMYTLDFSINNLKAVIEKLEQWIEENGGTRTTEPFVTDEVPEIVESVISDVSTRAPSISLIKWIIRAIKAIIEQAASDSVVGGMLVNWDFICSLDTPTSRNQYQYCPDHLMPSDTNNGEQNSKYYWGGSNDSWSAKRFSYVIGENEQVLVHLLRMRANGVLWHFSSPSGGLRTRIIRTFNFAHIHALSTFDGLDSRKNSKYRKLLKNYNTNVKPDVVKDKYFKISTP